MVIKKLVTHFRLNSLTNIVNICEQKMNLPCVLSSSNVLDCLRVLLVCLIHDSISARSCQGRFQEHQSAPGCVVSTCGWVQQGSHGQAPTGPLTWVLGRMTLNLDISNSFNQLSMHDIIVLFLLNLGGLVRAVGAVSLAACVPFRTGNLSTARKSLWSFSPFA